MKANRGKAFSAKKDLEDATEECKKNNKQLKADYERYFKEAASLKQT